MHLNIQYRADWLQTPPAFAMKLGPDMAIDNDAVRQAFAVNFDRNLGARNKTLIVNVKHARRYRNFNLFGRPGTPQHLEGIDQKWVSHRPEVWSWSKKIAPESSEYDSTMASSFSDRDPSSWRSPIAKRRRPVATVFTNLSSRISKLARR